MLAQNLSITTPFVSAGVFLQPPKYAIADLAPAEKTAGQTGLIQSYADHAYPQSACGSSTTNLQSLQSHANIVNFVKGFAPEIAAARAQGIDHVFGETNSATCGGGGISPTFGAALWIVDYVLQSVRAGSKRLYFHQGTIGNCQYCWWGRYSMGNPYYGAVLATRALAGISQVTQLDDGTSDYAAYGLYAGTTLARVLLINTQYYTSGTRPTQAFTLTNLPGSTGSGIRLTAASSTARADQGSPATVGRVSYQDGTCAASGSFQTEATAISGGSATFTVAASEALLVEIS
ncbi:hypothetical protein HD553DRAFT_340451 [Filobasidium floriforme]|uniref:uncharacterized protein n=1 Tax=Filobasidium floriforme TaxID=5210 RepID=UPI001E8DA7A1|nr:uncharacterized protein HD553DRAFT_340451 [Filobasidium floriforme]KAH8087289.1 hypothetical protein HD553DRAFT_340451 [Filobasidium floriforme]